MSSTFFGRVSERSIKGMIQTIDNYIDSVGDATLVLELRDSESNEILARVADRREAEAPAAGFGGNIPVTAWMQVHLLAQTWASRLRKRLEDIEKV